VDTRVTLIIMGTLRGWTIERTTQELYREFGSGYGDASNLNLIRQVRRVVKECQSLRLFDAERITELTGK
jgi:hypothetical protein